MELDELKKSWQTFGKALEQASVTDADRLASLMARYRQGANQGLARLAKVQQWSIYGGGLVFLLIVVLGYLYAFSQEEFPALRTHVLPDFMALTLIAAVAWDCFTYRHLRRIRVDEMPVAEVARRVSRFRRLVRYEVWGIVIWATLFTAIYYWYSRFYLLPWEAQLFLLGILVLFEAGFIFFIYRRLIYKQLRKVEKHVHQMEDICTE